MNMQKLMQEAQKMQTQLQREQNELEGTIYDGESAIVKVKVNGKKELVSIKIETEDSLSKEDIEMLEDMIMVAINDATKKAEQDKEKKLSKYGQGLAGLM